MSDKQPEENQGFTGKMKGARKLESRVSGLLHHEQVEKAKREFSQKWPDYLPSMPVRFTTKLERVESANLLRLLADTTPSDIWEKLSSIELHVAKKMDPHHPERVAIYYQDAPQGRRHVVGFLSDDVIEDLQSFGPARKEYSIYFRELHNLQSDASCVVEFVRPEMHICSSCGAEHFQETINCAECRSKRRRKNYDLEDAKEQAVTVPIAGALGQIQSKRFQREGEIKKGKAS